MKQVGAVAFFVGLGAVAFAAGADLPPEAGLREWVTVIGVAVTGLMCAQMGVWMIKEEI